MPNRKTTEQRVRASFRVRANAAGLCAGTQIFLAGCATAMPLALSSAWLAGLASLPLVCWLTFRSRRILMLQPSGYVSRIRYALLFFTLLASAVFALASVSVFAAQTLIQEARTLLIHAAVLCAAALCALSGGTGVARLCFALRFLLPALVLGLSLLGMPLRVPVGLFPILGAGAVPLAAAALTTLFGAAPVLLLALPPPELHDITAKSIPDTRFFLLRVLAGAAAGVLLLFFTSVCTTYESIAESSEWGARLRMAAGNQPHEGIFQMLLMLAKLLCILLLSANMLWGAQQALHLAVPKFHHAPCLALCILLAGAGQLALLIFGDALLLFSAPLIAIPAIAFAALPERRRHT